MMGDIVEKSIVVDGYHSFPWQWDCFLTEGLGWYVGYR
jgi:hypothetical protein